MHQSVVELETVNYLTEDRRLIEDYLLEITGAAVVMAEVRRRNRQFPHIYLTPFPLRTSVSFVVKAFCMFQDKRSVYQGGVEESDIVTNLSDEERYLPGRGAPL